jgi:hypothetical protein
VGGRASGIGPGFRRWNDITPFQFGSEQGPRRISQTKLFRNASSPETTTMVPFRALPPGSIKIAFRSWAWSHSQSVYSFVGRSHRV